MFATKFNRRRFLEFISTGILSYLLPDYSFASNLDISDHVTFLSSNSTAYSIHRRPFNKRVKLKPAYIALCKSELGVQYAINFARKKQLKVAIKSGGHSFEGFSLNDDGLVIDLSNMNSLSIYGANSLAVGPGCKLSELYEFLLPKNLIIPLGSCGGVGISGLTLGGGYGLFSRKWGLTCDNLIGVRMVDGEGRILDSESNPELLWACRGGGNGNFGVVTELRYKTHLAPKLLSQIKIKFKKLNARDATEIAKRWFLEAKRLPNDAFSAFVLNGRTLTILFTYFEKSSKQLVSNAVLALSANSGKVYPERTEKLSSAVIRYYGHSGSLHFKNVSAGFYKGFEDIEAIATEVFSDVFKTEGMLFQINTLGGAISDKSMNEKSAFAYRQLPFLGELQCYWNDDSQTQSKVSAVNSIQTKLHNAKINKHYRNYPSIELKNWGASYYGEKNYDRLQQIKSKLDPANRIQHPQSVVRKRS
jgi:FAD/FMN-containing dehydrogenase